MDTATPTTAIICLIQNGDNRYTQRIFEWAQDLLRRQTGVVEITSTTFATRYELAFELLFKIAMGQQVVTDTPPLRVAMFPCTQQVFGVTTEELAKKLGGLGLQVLGKDHPAAKKPDQA